MLAMAIEAEGVTVRRMGRVVLDAISLRIADGERVSVIGPNGAGKSTLMAALAGLLPLAAGTVRLDDRPMSRLRRREIARRIAYVPQSHDGYLGFRVREVIETGRYAHVEPLTPLGPQDHQAVAEAVATCGLGDLLDRPVDTLSGGERQKVWLAAALAQRSTMLLLDEPTSALDPAHQVELIRIINAFAAGGGTLVVICHDLNLPLALGGRVIALQAGRLNFDEPVAALEDTERLGRLFNTRFELHHGTEGRSRSIHPVVTEP